MVRNLGELGINLQKIVNRLIANQDLLKLLYYTDKDPLAGSNLTEQQIKEEIFDKLIRMTPTVKIEDSARSVVAIRITDGFLNNNNSEYRNIVVDFEIYVPHVSWFIKNSNFRVFAIMGELQKSLNGKTVNGLGKFKCGDFDLNFVSSETSCYILHGRFTEYD